MPSSASVHDPDDPRYTSPVLYPESDGKPMAETERRREVLGLRIERRGEVWRLVDATTGALVPTPEEERERAEQERERAEQERERADAAEAELARLRAELERAGVKLPQP